jgi:F-type H+-transporting ATPase subunit epsilon
LPTGKVRRLAVSAGFLEVKKDEVDLFVDAAEFEEEIDLARAKDAQERALARISEKAEGTDVERAKGALKRALNRIKVVEK